jgi:hypothetical protein
MTLWIWVGARNRAEALRGTLSCIAAGAVDPLVVIGCPPSRRDGPAPVATTSRGARERSDARTLPPERYSTVATHPHSVTTTTVAAPPGRPPYPNG